MQKEKKKKKNKSHRKKKIKINLYNKYINNNCLKNKKYILED